MAGHTVGETSERLLESLRRRAAKRDLRGRVEFVGALADPRAALARASCLLHCVERESFGLVRVEAMASRRPVIAPAVGGPLEILGDGWGQFFCPVTPGRPPRPWSSCWVILTRSSGPVNGLGSKPLRVHA